VHPLLASPQRLALYLAAWTLIAALLAAVYATASGAMAWEAVLTVFPLSLLFSFVCLSGWYVCRTTPLESSEAAQVVVAQAGSAVLATFLWVIFWEGWVRMLESPFPDVVPHYRGQFFLILGAGFLLYGLTAMFHYLLIAFEDSRQAETRELGLEVMAREAELKALRSQIDPHFLFNSLHSISALTSTDPSGARRMCLLLADFFRNNVRLGAEDWVALRDEMEMVRQYLDIERVRCGERLSVETVVDPDCGKCRVPPLILQPLVENAVRHGINSLLEGGKVSVRAACRSGVLSLVVENPFDCERPSSRKGSGVGLANVRRRLRTLFGGAAETRTSDNDGLFRVELSLPCDGGARRT
jgi:signal transduction histidine kinase